MLRDEQRRHEERLQQTEASLKSLRVMNVALSEDLQAMRRVCAALEEQCRAASTRAQFKDDIIREMRRQLKQAKAKVSPSSSLTSHDPGPSGAALLAEDESLSPDVSIIENSTSAPIFVDDTSTPLKARVKSLCSRFRDLKIHSSSSSTQLARESPCDRKPEVEPTSVKNESTQESQAASSVAGSGAGSGQCSAVTRALHYHEKLMSTLQILENKDEMIRIQADSLRLAESRISELTVRAEELRQKLQEKANELRLLQLQATEYDKNKTSVAVTADIQEHERVVRTLETNLSVIEELYRECFYEAAKQEQLIEMMRSDILDVRLMDKQKDTQIQKLQNVVHTQKWSIERCQVTAVQDIAMEVDNLKMEIFNFLNSSNNDSGMWERDPSPSDGDAIEDLREISAQLLTLREMLTSECTCGLDKENMRLKQAHAAMQLHIAELEQKLMDKETELTDKESVERRLEEDVDMKEQELIDTRQQLETQERCCEEKTAECEALTRQLKQAEVLLSDKSTELAALQQLYEQEQGAVRELKEALQQRASNLSKENVKIRDEVQSLRGEVSMWRAQLADSERRARALQEQLQRARELCRKVDCSYQEKARCASVLQSQLEEAQERGHSLCADTHHVLEAVRRWTRAARDTRRDQEQKIKEQQETIESLQRQLNEKTNDRSGFEPCCSKYIPRPRSQRSFDADVGRVASCSRVCGRGRAESATEMAGGASAPVPPLRKKSSVDRLCLCSSQREKSQPTRVASRESQAHTNRQEDTSQESSDAQPVTSQPASRQDADVRYIRVFANPFHPREQSPARELQARVSQLHAALSRRQRRWSRARSASHNR